MERKTMTADEIRAQLFLSKQAVKNYLNLGVLTPVPGTEDSEEPLYYADEVAVIREAMTSCESSIKRLNAIRNKVIAEIDKANTALATLELDAVLKERYANSLIDSIALFMKAAVPNLESCRYPLYALAYFEDKSVERIMKCIEGYSPSTQHAPEDFCNDLNKELEGLTPAIIMTALDEKEELTKENEELKSKIEELKHKIELMADAPEAKTYLASNGFCKELSEKQVEGLKQSILECGFTRRSLNCLKVVIDSDKEPILANIVSYHMSEVKRFRNFGKNSLQEVVDKLAEYDLTFGMEIVEIKGKYYQK